MKQIYTYTSICGNYDNPRSDIECFTDKNNDKFVFPVMNAKIYKILTHKYFSHSITLYIDGNIYLNESEDIIVKEFLQDADMALFKHPWRKCLYEEAKIVRTDCILPTYQTLLDEQINHYRKEGMPADFGLGECGVLIRRNNDLTAEFNERWWAEICRYTYRDQVSFPYVLWNMKDRIKVNFIEGNVRDHSYFKYVNRSSGLKV